MATIYLVRDGRGEGHTSRGHEVAIEKATDTLSKFAVHFSQSGPVINPDAPFSATSAYRHVVLEVHSGEENSKFPTAGFYLIAGLDPRTCASMFGIYY